MKQLITIDLTQRTTDWTPPVLTFGETLTLAMRFTKNVNGNDVAPNLTFSACSGTLGPRDQRPFGGPWALQIGADPSTGANTTATLQADITATALAAAINALAGVVSAYGTAKVQKVNGSWLLHFGNGGTQVPLKVVQNGLFPISFGTTGAWTVDNRWVHSVRLVIAPGAFTSVFDTVLPPSPTIVRKESGGQSGSVSYNEIQTLYVPPTFQGAYTIKQGFARTPLISPDSGPTDIQTALNAGIGDGFNVTLPVSYTFLMEFIDGFAGAPQNLMTVEVEQAPAGDLTITLDLTKEELASMIRASTTPGSITLPLQIDITASEDGADAEKTTSVILALTVQASLNLPEMQTVETVDWLVPTSPTTYTPAGTDNVLTGEKIYAVNQGDAVHTAFAIGHPLASTDVDIDVHDLASGRVLINGTDYTAVINSAGQVTVTALLVTPTANQWRVLIVSAQTVASWIDDLTVTIEQVTGLEDELDAFNGRITNLETLLPASATLSGTVAGAANITIPLVAASEILFALDANGVAITDPTKLVDPAPYLIPAIDSATNLGALPTSPFPDPALGALYTTAAATLIRGGGQIKSSYSTAAGFVGSDGRINIPMTRSGTTNSYYASPYMRPIFEAYISHLQFAPGAKLALAFQVALQILHSRGAEGQWVLVVEQGATSQDADGPPTTFDSNLADVTWNTTTPLLRIPLFITPTVQQHFFGVNMANTAGTITANAQYYNQIVAANSAAPASADFWLRARWINFDVRHRVTNARGWVSWALQPPPTGTLGIVITG